MSFNISVSVHPMKAPAACHLRIFPLLQNRLVMALVQIGDMHDSQIPYGILEIIVAVVINHFASVRNIPAELILKRQFILSAQTPFASGLFGAVGTVIRFVSKHSVIVQAKTYCQGILGQIFSVRLLDPGNPPPLRRHTHRKIDRRIQPFWLPLSQLTQIFIRRIAGTVHLSPIPYKKSLQDKNVIAVVIYHFLELSHMSSNHIQAIRLIFFIFSRPVIQKPNDQLLVRFFQGIKQRIDILKPCLADFPLPIFLKVNLNQGKTCSLILLISVLHKLRIIYFLICDFKKINIVIPPSGISKLAGRFRKLTALGIHVFPAVTDRDHPACKYERRHNAA